MEFFVDKYKIGYFVVSVQKNSLLVHTFLFLTNDGTPEGKKLAKLTHLKLLDKQFLGIDQIAAFMQYNIIGDAALRNLFISAGCESLLSYVDEAFPKELLPLESTAFLHKYLGNVAGLSRNTKLLLT